MDRFTGPATLNLNAVRAVIGGMAWRVERERTVAHTTTARTALRWALVVAVAALAAAAAVTRADAAPAGVQYVKYYQVTSSYQGAPENLSEISARFLGTTSRAAELFVLNSGRKQPDWAALSDPAVLHAGWALVLPWDAVGPGVQYGVLPTTTGTDPNKSSASAPKPAVSPSPAASPQPNQHCFAATASSATPDWASLRLAPDQAWAHSRGKGELVAVIDSGVDGSLSQLAGHLSVGADVVAGTGRGDVDCLGTGTAMASIVAAQPAQGSAMTGIAPDATVMPVRVVTTTPKAQTTDQVTAINAAVSAGATVIALGGYIDPTDPTIAPAIASATDHDVVVVAAARTEGQPDSGSARPAPAVLHVGGVGVDGQPVAQYVAGAVDVVAPGLNVATLGMNGAGVQSATGTQYAVAYVAGEVALVRAAYPQLTAAEVCHRIKVTADKLSASVPDGRSGYGMINPGPSVTQVLAEEQRSATAAARPVAGGSALRSSNSRQAVTLVAGLVGLVALLLLILRVRALMRAGRETGPAPVEDAWADAQPSEPAAPHNGTGRESG
jgi:membrane-anchored mycosin MYCP